MNAFCYMYFACMFRLEAYLLGAQQREWVSWGWGGWCVIIISPHKKPGGQPVEKADEQEVAEMQHALRCLRNGWRWRGKTRPRGSSGHQHPSATSSSRVPPHVQQICAEKEPEDSIKTFALYSLISARRVIASPKARESEIQPGCKIK